MSNYLVVGPNVKVLPDQPINNLTGATSASLMGAGNEFLSFQIVIAAGANPLTGLDASVPGPIGSDGFQIPAADVRLYREDYYEVGTNKQSGPDGNPGRWPDPLIPITDPFYDEDRGAFPIDIPANENRVIWVDVFIAAGTPRGGYQGVVQVSTDAWTEQVRVDVTVVAFTLPPTSTLRSAFTMTPSATGTAFGLDCTGNNAPPSEACWALNELFVATALDHRITISGPAPDKLNSDTIPYFNKYVRPYLDGTGTSKTKLPKAQLTTIEYTHDLAAWQHAVGPLNTDAEPFVYFRGSDICDEIYINKLMTCAQWQSTCWPLIQTALNAWPHARILMTVDIQTSDACGIAAAINGANSGGDVILAPVIDHMDGNPQFSPPNGTQFPYPNCQRNKYDTFLQRHGNEVWLYLSCDSSGCVPNNDPAYHGWASYAIDVGAATQDAPASQNGAMGWLCYLYNVTGLMYYETVATLSRAWQPGKQYQNNQNGDGNLFYPGGGSQGYPVHGTHPIPVESIRLKQIRDGLQAYEYLKHLSDVGQGVTANSIATSLFQHGWDTIRSDTQVDEAHRRLALAVDNATTGSFTATQVSTARLSDGRLQLWAVDQHGGVSSTWKQSTDPDAPWGPWVDFLASIGELPAPAVQLNAAALSDGRLQLWAVDQHGGVSSTWKQSTDPDAPWGPWVDFLASTGEPSASAGH